ncbi:MAG: sugar ABC transporter permease [Firmicutes bacterium]|nr:sugar ABC transporter permease [Bacillota bacterium]
MSTSRTVADSSPIPSRRPRRVTPGRLFDDIATYTALLAVSAVFVFPALWLVLASLSKTGDLFSFRGFFPSAYSIDTFRDLFTNDVNGLYPYGKWFINTLYVAGVSSVLGTLLVILTGYVMSRFQFKGRDAIKKATLLLGIFPGFMGMTAIFIIVAQLGLLNRLEALILLYAGTAPLGYLVQKGYFDSVPGSIHEAAKMDGASQLTIFIRVTLPLSKPMIVYTALTTFAWPWSDCLLPQLLLKNREVWTVAVGLYNMPDQQFARFAAGSVFIAVPIVILYFCLVKYIVSGLTAGAVKE